MAVTVTAKAKLNPFRTRGPRDPLGYWFATATVTGDVSGGNADLDIELHQSLAFSIEHIGLDDSGVTAHLYDLLLDTGERDGSNDIGRGFSGGMEVGVTQSALPAALVLPYPRAVFRPAPGFTPTISATLANVLNRIYFLRARGLCWPLEAYREPGGPMFPGDVYT